MSDLPTQAPPEPPEAPLVRRRWRFSLVWLVPATAAIIGLAMLVHAWMAAGNDITIGFRTAAGLEAGKTLVKYKDVAVGKVAAIALSDDGAKVLVSVSLTKNAGNLTRKDTRFWVVRPRISSSGVSGIDTLLSGAYIGADMGTSEETAKHFTGLETPPAVIRGSPGKAFNLRAPDLGSLDIGSPVYYKRILVGRVTSYQLGSDGKHVDVQIFVDSPYERFVTTDARFWNASGVDAAVNADGFTLKTQSLTTIVAGGIAFDVPDGAAGTTSTAQTTFTLAADQKTALAPPDGPQQTFELRFDKPVRGLGVGSTVKFLGIDLGHVASIDLDFDPATQRFPTVVEIVVYPKRLGHVLDKLPKADGDIEQQMAQIVGGMVARGLRARARSGNLLTGQQYVSLDFVRQAPKVIFNPNARPLVLPTMGGGFDDIQEQVASIVKKVDRMPLESIANHLNDSLSNLDQTLKQVNGQVLPQGTRTLQQAQRTFGAAESVFAEDAPLQQNIGQTLQEVQQAARAVRTLADMLGRHPEALVRGLKASEQRPATPTRQAPPEPESTR